MLLLLGFLFQNVLSERVIVYEGDTMRYKEASSTGLQFRSALSDKKKKWQNGEVVFQFAPDNFTASEMNQLEGAMNEIQKASCVVFLLKDSYDTDYVTFIKPLNRICRSFIGRQGGEQIVELHVDCFQRKTLLHELMHVLGFVHEHTRSDRDQYITIMWKNMKEGYRRDYEKREKSELTLLDTPYAYNSVMHYSGIDDSSVNGGPVMVAKQPGITLGPLENQLSDIDILRINRLYDCPQKVSQVTQAPTSNVGSATNEQQWRPRLDGTYWSINCDFNGRDVEVIESERMDCPNTCAVHPTCTHFTWFANKNGECHLKAGFPFQFRPYCTEPVADGVEVTICGFVGEPNELQLSETVACRPL